MADLVGAYDLNLRTTRCKYVSEVYSDLTLIKYLKVRKVNGGGNSDGEVLLLVESVSSSSTSTVTVTVVKIVVTSRFDLYDRILLLGVEQCDDDVPAPAPATKAILRHICFASHCSNKAPGKNISNIHNTLIEKHKERPKRCINFILLTFCWESIKTFWFYAEAREAAGHGLLLEFLGRAASKNAPSNATQLRRNPPGGTSSQLVNGNSYHRIGEIKSVGAVSNCLMKRRDPGVSQTGMARLGIMLRREEENGMMGRLGVRKKEERVERKDGTQEEKEGRKARPGPKAAKLIRPNSDEIFNVEDRGVKVEFGGELVGAAAL
ncbi:hypothetical protein V1478_013325 [Vespula squamosa]|uniref:Uncharacterized protein n=1 Tax=Vespula squamosa TaxID=30214 RepID=A0ABD2ACP5_VESSQ